LWAIHDNYRGGILVKCVKAATRKWQSKFPVYDVFIGNQYCTTGQSLRTDRSWAIQLARQRAPQRHEPHVLCARTHGTELQKRRADIAAVRIMSTTALTAQRTTSMVPNGSSYDVCSGGKLNGSSAFGQCQFAA
jgi:hypothetical protein